MASRGRTRTVVIAAGAGLVVTIAAAVGIRKLVRIERLAVITGAVVANSKDLHRQRPVGNTSVAARYESVSWKAVSEVSGLSRLRLDPPIAADDVFEVRV